MAGKKRKKPLWKKLLLVACIALIVSAGLYFNKKSIRRAYRYFAHKYYRKDFKPSDFPLDYDIHGIDISHYQDIADWKKLYAVDSYGDTIHFRFVFMKATEGLLSGDDTFGDNWTDARDNHFTRGAYHYFLPDRSPAMQAKNFISSVRLQNGDLPPVVDVEETKGRTKSEIVNNLKAYLTIIQENYKVKPVIYSNLNFIEDYLLDDFKDYKFWVAHYYKDDLEVDDSLQWLFWQHSDKANLLGVIGNTDADVFNGTEQDFDSLLIK